LEKYYEDIKKVEVSLKVVKPEAAENKEAGIKILIPNGEFYASKVCRLLFSNWLTSLLKRFFIFASF
jgi:hypothetical protein